MCDPVSMAVVGSSLGASQSILGFAGQNQAHSQAVQAADASYANTSNSLQTQETQIDRQQSENTVTAMINAAANRGKVSASASSMGADGATTTQLVNAGNFDVGRALSIADQNSESLRQRNSQDLTDANIKRQSAINAVPDGSIAGLLTGIAGAGIAGAGTALKLGGT